MKSQVLLSFVVLRKTQKPRVINNLSVWSRVQASCPKRRAHVLRSLKLRLDTYRIYSTTYYVLTSHVRLLTTHNLFSFRQPDIKPQTLAPRSLPQNRATMKYISIASLLVLATSASAFIPSVAPLRTRYVLRGDFRRAHQFDAMKLFRDLVAAYFNEGEVAWLLQFFSVSGEISVPSLLKGYPIFSAMGRLQWRMTSLLFPHEGVIRVYIQNLLTIYFPSPAVCPLMPNMPMTRLPKRPMPTAPGNLGRLILIASPRTTLRSWSHLNTPSQTTRKGERRNQLFYFRLSNL